ncbi:MAG: proline--tRNA ligase [Candidatus Roizmanbacteria bacterium]|nr:proline--tRNA ligase [Candidatus Roizmanbacteria bacterium]
MRYSKLFGKTVREAPSDASMDSYKLLYQAGFIRESTAGRFFFLPLGIKMQQNIMKVVKEEMYKAGAQELVSPVLHPLELWKETNRTNTAGFELMRVKDRRDAEFALGGTAEEMFVDVVRKFQISYKEMPFNIYQFSTKFRDELRARGGLLRVREFIMKDAYSFDVNEEEFKKEYKNMGDTYSRIFKRLGLDTVVVESDGGYIGGDYCHEYVVDSPIGETNYLTTEDGSYNAHEEVATFDPEVINSNDEMLPLQTVDAVRGTSMNAGVKFHNMPLTHQIKDVLFVDEKGRFILAVLRGDFDANELKLKHAVKAITLRHATAEEIVSALHSVPGFISPVKIHDLAEKNVNLVVVVDPSLKTVKNAYGGANELNKDLLNVNYGRDFVADIEADIALAKEGHVKNGKKLTMKKGIEVGNIFQLGYHYTKLMKGAVFTDKDGIEKPYYMGCYGIGIGRTMATIVEQYHDERGMTLPENVAPYKVHLIAIGKDEAPFEKADQLIKLLEDKGIEVLFDDRTDVSPGAKFADADLIGCPYRLVISPKTGDNIELKKRTEKETKLVSMEELLKIFIL